MPSGTFKVLEIHSEPSRTVVVAEIAMPLLKEKPTWTADSPSSAIAPRAPTPHGREAG